MKKLGRLFLVLSAGLASGLALVSSAAGTTATPGVKVRHLQVSVAALAIQGDRVAYDASSWLDAKPSPNKVFVWNVSTGKTIKVSGKKTAAADSSSTGAGVFQLALAGSRVAWLMNEGGNLEGDDYLFTSSLTSPKEHQVASEIRQGTFCPGRSAGSCAGKWLGGVVGSGNLIAANRWTTDALGGVTAGELDLLSGTTLKRIATGAGTVQAADADGKRVAVLRRGRRSLLDRGQAAADDRHAVEHGGGCPPGQKPGGGHQDSAARALQRADRVAPEDVVCGR